MSRGLDFQKKFHCLQSFNVMRTVCLVIGLAVCFGLAGPPPSTAQAPPAERSDSTTLVEALREHRLPLRLDGGELRGDGGTWLRERATEASVVTLGESHGTREIPAVMAALIEDLQAADEFDHLAIETSPWTADLLTERLREGKAAYDTLVSNYPAAIPFYNLKSERDLLYQVVANSEHKRPLWGLDQIFAFSAALAFDRLKELAPSDSARSAVEAVRAAGEQRAAEHSDLQDLPPGLPPPLSVYDSTTFDTLRTHFEGIDEADRLLSELETSTPIYRLNDTNNYRSNQLRARYLRDNLRQPFLQARSDATASPNVVIKVGGFHAYRGRTPNNALDVGNLAVTLARMTGGEALNVAVLCGPGSKNTQFPTGTGDCYRLGEPFAEALGEGPALFDLEGLHPLLHDGTVTAEDFLADVLWAFDAVVLLPDARPAEPIVPPVKP